MKRAGVILGCALLAVAAHAQDNEIQSPVNGHFYSLIPFEIGSNVWAAQRDVAEANGGFLVTIRNQAENDWIVDTFGPMITGDSLFTGFNDVDEEGTFVWHSGEPVTYTNWNDGEPNNSGGEDVMEITFPSGGWNDNGNNELQFALMERIVFVFQNTPTGGGFVFEGEDVTLAATVVGGTGPVTYQWRKDGADIVGETADTLMLSSVTSADDGTYVLAATDGSKATILSPATSITVVAPGSLPVGGLAATGIAMLLLSATGVGAVIRRRKR